jgi:uncharacterized protein YbjQ (UPF0145 family)
MTDRPVTAADLAIDALRHDGAGADAAVTSLSVDEAILLDQVGFEPLGMVTGASVVAVSNLVRLSGGFSDNLELEQLSAALEATRTNAIERIASNARQLGADGVVGVSLDIGDIGGGSNLVHMVATGTALKTVGTKHRPGRDSCFTAAVSGQELHLLTRAGYRPLGIVSGVCAYHVGRRAFGAWAGSVKINQEMTIYTEALYDARELAMGRLQDMALGLGADGVIGVIVSERSGAWGSHVIEFSCIGTAVKLVAGEHQPLEPKLMVDLAGN